MSRAATTIGVLAAAIAIGWVPSREAAGAAGYCTQTATGANTACGLEARDDYAKAQAICINLSNAAERTACQAEAGSIRSRTPRSRLWVEPNRCETNPAGGTITRRGLAIDSGSCGRIVRCSGHPTAGSRLRSPRRSPPPRSRTS